MLSQLLSKLFQTQSPTKSGQTSLKSSESSVSLPAPLQGSSNKADWISQAKQQITRHEGEVLHAYDDHLGFATIGVGRLIDKRKSGGITHDEAQYLLNNDIATRVEALQAKLPWFDSLPDVRKGVLLNMSFQLGIAGLLGFGRTLEMVKMGDYIGAADNMLKSKWAQQTPNRANELANQMRTNTWQSG